MKYFEEDIFFQDIVSEIISFRIAYIQEGQPVYFYVRLKEIILKEKILVYYCSESNGHIENHPSVPFNTHLSAICLTSEGVYGFHCVAQPFGSSIYSDHFYILYPRHIWRIERRKKRRLTCLHTVSIHSEEGRFLGDASLVDLSDKGLCIDTSFQLEGQQFLIFLKNQKLCKVRLVWFKERGHSFWRYGMFIQDKLDDFNCFLMSMNEKKDSDIR